jgi:hypothetical protein
VDKRLAGIVGLDDLSGGQQIELSVMQAGETTGFEHQFESERSEPRAVFRSLARVAAGRNRSRGKKR